MADGDHQKIIETVLGLVRAATVHYALQTLVGLLGPHPDTTKEAP